MSQNQPTIMTQQEIERANLANLAEQEAVSKEENVTTEAAVTAVETETPADQESVYKKELARLEAEKQEKSDALTVERSKRKAAEKAAEAIAAKTEEDKKNTLGADDIDRLLEEKLAKRDFEQLIKQETADPDEQKLIKLHYENSIKRTGNVAADLKMAAAIANQHLVDQVKAQTFEREQTEGRMTAFQAGRSSGRTGHPAYQTDPSLKAAGAFLDKLGMGDAKKFLGK